MIFVFRNNTVERFFDSEYSFSGYGDISFIPQDADSYVWFYQVPLRGRVHDSVEEVRAYAQNLRYVVEHISEQKNIVVFTLESRSTTAVVSSDNSLQLAVADFNVQLFDLSEQHANIRIVNISDFTCRYANNELLDFKYFFMAQMPYSPKLAAPFKSWMKSQMRSLRLERKKCLVLDLDNTLWSGVLGEDGIDGIQCSGDYPGKAFHFWQEQLIEFYASGVILTICSKNNEADVWELFAKNPNLVLKKEHFAAWRINWSDKASNLQSLAQELNIGLDSFVFVDDNPSERELIRQQLPMVAVPDFPEQPYMLPDLYRSLVENYFSVYNITTEDKHKTEQYRANAARREEAARFTDFSDYLRSLCIQLTIQPANEFSVSRIAQMTQKTNQFNLTTRRYTESDILTMMADGWTIFTLSVADRFGDSGISGLMIISPKNEIDTLLLSCRVLGKQIEEAFMKIVMNTMRQRGTQRLTATYLPTAKNSQVEDFYDKFNPAACVQSNEGEKKYVFELKDDYSVPDYYEIL